MKENPSEERAAMVEDADDVNDCETSPQSSSSAIGADGSGETMESFRLFFVFVTDPTSACCSSDLLRFFFDCSAVIGGEMDGDESGNDEDDDVDEVDASI